MAGPVIKPKANRHDSHFEYKHLHKGRCLFTYLLCLSVSFLSPSSVDQQHNTTERSQQRQNHDNPESSLSLCSIPVSQPTTHSSFPFSELFFSFSTFRI